MADINTLMQQSPLPEMLERLGVAIANAQYAIDKKSLQIAQLMADTENGLQLGPDGEKRSLLELGFTPTFYHLSEATIDARVAFSIGQSSEFSVGASVGVNIYFFAASVNASYTAKYSFDASASSAIRARFVSVPPPTVLADLLRSTFTRKTGG
ncbi:hypothetical protein JRI60_46090 [Archangium violaceum]|uniref:hypothetical protein n=1 Tax=Archangium violaceum TaxID=83451 RepID=UPI00194F20A7|nr:hypothetical protein [Archangium violaceum]QRN96312.1 hypothetical protein JRI60_46090 [Archangium violaceum]